MDLENINIPGELAIIFKTSLPAAYKEDELPITVDTKSSPKDLSEIVVELIKSGGSIEGADLEGTQFQFKVRGKLLRGSLKSHLIANQITSEETVEIEYSFAPAMPTMESSNQEEDWICSIMGEAGVKTYDNFYVTTFGGSLSVYNNENKRKIMKKITDQVILTSELIEW